MSVFLTVCFVSFRMVWCPSWSPRFCVTASMTSTLPRRSQSRWVPGKFHDMVLMWEKHDGVMPRQITPIVIQEDVLENVIAKWRPFCLSLNVLNYWGSVAYMHLKMSSWLVQLMAWQHYLNQCWLINWTLRAKFSENYNHFLWRKCITKWRPFCHYLSVITDDCLFPIRCWPSSTRPLLTTTSSWRVPFSNPTWSPPASLTRLRSTAPLM